MEIETEEGFVYSVVFAIALDLQAETISAEVDVASVYLDDKDFFAKCELGPELAARLCRTAEERILNDGDEFDAIAAEIEKLEAERVEDDDADFHCSTPEVPE